MLAVLEEQATALAPDATARDILACVQGLWRDDMEKGVAAFAQSLACERRMKEWIEKAEGGQVANLDLPELTDSPFRVFVAKVLKGLPGEATQRWSKLLDDEPAGWCATLRLRGTLEAALLHRWHTGHKPTNPRKFHSQYGMSRQGDIDHLAAYVPYVDAFMTDDSTFALCGDELVAQELRHYPAKLVARRNYAEFDAWLDELLGQPPPVLFNSA